MKTCETCAYWDEKHEFDRSKNIRRCNKAVQLFDAEEWVDVDGETKLVMLPEHKDQMMFTQDASSYHASLYTRNDFFCAHWEEMDE